MVSFVYLFIHEYNRKILHGEVNGENHAIRPMERQQMTILQNIYVLYQMCF